MRSFEMKRILFLVLTIFLGIGSAFATNENSDVTVSLAGGNLINIRTKYTTNTVDFTWIRATSAWGCTRAEWNTERNEAWTNPTGYPAGIGWQNVDGITQILLAPNTAANGQNTKDQGTTILIPASPQQLAAAFEAAHIPPTLLNLAK